MLLFALMALIPAAFGGGIEAKSSREALPAREAERPILIPKGWTDLSAIVGLERQTDEVSDRVDTVVIRRGVLPRHELWVALGLRESLIRPTLGWRWSLLRTEAPSAAVALEVQWSDPDALRYGLAMRREVGALRLTARGAGIYRYLSDKGAAVGSVEALLQAGFLAFAAKPGVYIERGDATFDLRLRGEVQWTRGFDTSVLVGVPVDGRGLVHIAGVQIRSRF